MRWTANPHNNNGPAYRTLRVLLYRIEETLHAFLDIVWMCGACLVSTRSVLFHKTNQIIRLLWQNAGGLRCSQYERSSSMLPVYMMS